MLTARQCHRDRFTRQVTQDVKKAGIRWWREVRTCRPYDSMPLGDVIPLAAIDMSGICPCGGCCGIAASGCICCCECCCCVGTTSARFCVAVASSVDASPRAEVWSVTGCGAADAGVDFVLTDFDTLIERTEPACTYSGWHSSVSTHPKIGQGTMCRCETLRWYHFVRMYKS